MSDDDILARIDEVVDDYVEWDGWSPDAATWSADGSHQPDEISGDYYGDDDPPWGRNQLLLTLEELVGNPVRDEQHPDLAVGVTSAAEQAGAALQDWQRDMFERQASAVRALAALNVERVNRGYEATLAVRDRLNPTVSCDDRRTRPRRSGRDAQTSPYPAPGRRR